MHDLLDSQVKYHAQMTPVYSHKEKLMKLEGQMGRWADTEGFKYSEGDDISKLFQKDLFWLKDMLDNLVFRDEPRLDTDEMLTANEKFRRWKT